MSAFEKFLKANCIKQQDLAKYLDVHSTFITSLKHGQPIPPKKLQLLLDNPFGWDTSALKESDGNQYVNSVVNSAGASNEQGLNSRLVDIIQEQQRQMAMLIESISSLTGKIQAK